MKASYVQELSLIEQSWGDIWCMWPQCPRRGTYKVLRPGEYFLGVYCPEHTRDDEEED